MPQTNYSGFIVTMGDSAWIHRSAPAARKRAEQLSRDYPRYKVGIGTYNINNILECTFAFKRVGRGKN